MHNHKPNSYLYIRVFACTTEFHFNKTCVTSVLPLLFSLQHSQEPIALIHSSMTSYRGVGQGAQWPTEPNR